SPTAVHGAVVGGVPATRAGGGLPDEAEEQSASPSSTNVPDRTDEM
ncbi:MAG: GtrA family protein, partial [Actinomyces urogenitalis DORA_12]